jgi:hypothetical protein
MIRLIFFVFLFSNQAFGQGTDPLKAERDGLILEKEKHNEWEKEQISILNKTAEDIKTSQDETARLVNLSINHSKYLKQVTEEAEESLRRLPALKRIASKKATFYRCVKESLAKRASAGIPLCRTHHSAKFTEEEEQKLKEWKDIASLTPGEIKVKQSQVQSELVANGSKLVQAQKNLKNGDLAKERIEAKENVLKQKEFDREVIKANAAVVNCDANTPEVSLEEKVPYPGAKFQGPFFGVPRDNQDGLGTCYANAAKNLLVGVSDGESIASFLDLALIYKDEMGGVSGSGLSGGFTCTVLNKVNEKGFCPQSLAPFETGDKNLYAEGLMGEGNGTIWDQAALVGLVQRFLVGEEKFRKGKGAVSEEVLGRAKFIIDTIKTKPNLKLPLPVARFDIPGMWKVKEAYFWHVKKNYDVTEEKFIADYKAEYQKFYPLYIKGVMEGKSADQLFSLFKQNMKGLIGTYRLDSQLETWRLSYLNDVSDDFKDPNLQKNIGESIDFLKQISGQEKTSNDNFFAFCGDQTEGMTDFLTNLQSLVKHLDAKKIDSDALFDKTGKFKTPTDLMQLVVAPACLNSDQRKKLKSKIHCNDGYETIRDIKSSNMSIQDQKRALREKVVASLVQGIPLGNTFDHHINTIVGMRFDPASKQCEFKIRESQTGSSSWQNETRIFNEIEALTEVRKK